MAANISLSQTDETLSREHPMSDFMRNQKSSIRDMSQEEFMKKYEDHVAKHHQDSNGNVDKVIIQNGNSGPSSEGRHNRSRGASGFLKKIILKFTTVSEGVNEAASFTVDINGGTIGRHSENHISVPTDNRLALNSHARIEFIKGYFYIVDCGFEYAASVRMGVGMALNKNWSLDKSARFSVGNSIFECQGYTDQNHLAISAIDGPLKGETRIISQVGATFGRSSENSVSIPDRELSRKHSRIDYDDKSGKYVLSDVGSTNGTYIQLVGPNGGKHRLSLNDHILVGRTGFSINRFDYGLSEEIGFRQTMEDSCTIVQHLNIGPLCVKGLAPQSFFAVFDGHGGNQASLYLSQHLHVNIADALVNESVDILRAMDTHDTSEGDFLDLTNIPDNHRAWKTIDSIVTSTLVNTFLRTDNNFIASSNSPQHGSTATTALILGSRLYCANVGDSRVILCRRFKAISLTEDHKPSREDETKRILDAGGFVINNRVMGELAVSRAFGDCDFKKGLQGIIEDDIQSGAKLRDGVEIDTNNWDQPLIIAEPDVKITSLTEDDQFLLLACDGLFDVFSNEDIVSFVKSNMEDHRDAQRCCQNLTHEAIRKRNSRDNVSVILIILNKWF